MFKRLSHKTKKENEVSAAPKPPFSARVRTSWNTAAAQMVEFKENDAKSFMKWMALYFFISLFSIFVTNFKTENILPEFPLVLALLIPRMFSLFMVTCPVLNLKKRKSAFLLMASLWLLWYSIAYNKAGFGVIIFIILVLICVIMYMAETPNTSVKYQSLFNKMTLLLLTSFLFVFILQIAQMKNFIKPFSTFLLSPDILACNLLCFTAIGSFVFWVRRPKTAISCYMVIWTVLSVISFCKSRNTFEPVLFLDVFSLGEGIRAFFSYYSWFFIVGACALILLAIAAIIYLSTRESKKTFSFIKLICSTLFLVVAFCGIFYMSKLNVMSSESKTAKAEYDKKGFVYSFLFYSVDSFVKQPEGYGATVIETINDKIKNEYQSYGNGTDNVQNVIVIQLESFTDPGNFPGIVLEEDPMPFIHSLMSEYSSGYVGVPVFGGLTVKSEFEFLSGLSIDNLPLGYNPFVQYLPDNPIDSITRYFDKEGFETTAIHNYQGEFFSRHSDYKNLGFDYYVPYECMPDVQKKEDKIWANDEVFVNHITEALDHNDDGKNFIFGVTVQMHGNYYPISEDEYPMKIKGIANKETEGAMAYYIQQLQDVDNMIRDLIAALTAREESTYVLFYGDHLPSLFGESGQELSYEEKYSTPFFTWNNMGIPKAQRQDRPDNTPVYIPDMQLYDLSTFMTHELKIDGSYMNKFHTVYDDAQKYAQEFSSIQYYKMYDEKNDVDFSNESYTIGIVPLSVTDVKRADAGVNSYVFKGTGFTSDTYVCFNNKIVYEVEFIDENTIILNDIPDAPSQDDLFTVRILGEKMGTVLKESAEYEWSTFIS